MTIVNVKCANGHELAIDVPRPAGFLKLCKSGKRVCPSCQPDNVRLSPFEPETSSFVNDKKYACKHGHVTSFVPFTSGMINVTWGEEFENVPGRPEDVQEWIEQGTLKCRHTSVNATGRKRKCACKLKPVDDAVLAYGNSFGIKTKTRVGDIWDKNDCVEAKDSHVETFKKHGVEDARHVETEFSRRNKRRLADIRKKRQTEAKGEVLKRPTDTRSGEKLSKGQALKQSRKDYD
jgi:hypothetical protein